MKTPIYPCLWFNNNAKAAADAYCKAFANTKIISENPIVVILEIDGQKIMLLNGGPNYKPNPSLSLFVTCTTEAEVESIWEKLSNNSQVLMPLDKYPWSPKYGWLQDCYGVSWQIFASPNKVVDQKVTPALMLTGDLFGRAAEAMKLYTSLFKNSAIESVSLYDENDGDKPGMIKHAQFSLNGYKLKVMESSFDHKFSFNEGVSLVVECEDQQEVDHFWNSLTADGGEESMCGWLKDKFGVSWQIVPAILGQLMSDPARSQRVVNAFLKMKKFDIQALMNA
jgi:predicted 3-demethylubiquinone-9 3-methyltransferase (glyoxalase superfamily)